MDNLQLNDNELLKNSKPLIASMSGILNKATGSDFLSETRSRLGGVDKNTFELEVQAWSEAFAILPAYDREVYCMEISEMEIQLQSNSNFSFEALAMLYSSQVAYRNRLTAMKNIVNAHYEIYNQAYKSLDKQAFRLFSKAGGSVDDRRADAAHLVAPFLRLVTHAKIMLDQIEEMISTIEFSAFQLSRLLREREALAKIHGTYDREGQNARLQTEHTRRGRLERKVDEDGFEEI